MEFVHAFSFIGDNPGLMWSKTAYLLEISAISLAIAVGLGLPLGVFLGHLHRFSLVAINISNIGRALPSLAVLAILLGLIGIGPTGVVIALVLLAFPPILTNSYVAVDQVDREVVDAAKGTGLRPLQVLLKVELPLALPLIFAGIRTSAVFVVATTTLGGIFGGGGLGDILNNRESYGVAGIIACCYVLIVVAFLVQGLFVLAERMVTPAGLKIGSGRSVLTRQRATVLTRGGETAADESSLEQSESEDQPDRVTAG